MHARREAPCRASGLCAPGLNEAFRLHSQRVGNAGDVVEICHHLRCVVDGHVVETNGPQLFQVVLIADSLGHADGEPTKSLVEFAQSRTPPILYHLMNKRVDLFRGRGIGRARLQLLLDLFTEVVRMRLRSVEALQLG